METLSIVAPCYNEEAGLHHFYDELVKVLKEIGLEYEIIFINDGSKDQTLSIIKALAKEHSEVAYIHFSRNFGKEAAMLAGFNKAKGTLVAVMDTDLQHPPYLLKEMYQRILDKDLDVVATRRISRAGEPAVRSWFARKFYHLINRMSEVQIVEGAQDYRMMKRDVVDSILALPEYHRFSKGIFSWVGFDTEYIPVENVERFAGETSWSFRTLFKYAIEGIVSFSTTPLRFTTVIGFLISIGSFLYLMIVLFQAIFMGIRTAGYASTMVIILFLGSIQLIGLGIIGEYIARTYLETKRRPNYFIKQQNNSNLEESDLK